jgi:hypothetical protein
MVKQGIRGALLHACATVLPCKAILLYHACVTALPCKARQCTFRLRAERHRLASLCAPCKGGWVSNAAPVAIKTHPHPSQEDCACKRNPFRRRIACDPNSLLHPLEGEGAFKVLLGTPLRADFPRMQYQIPFSPCTQPNQSFLRDGGDQRASSVVNAGQCEASAAGCIGTFHREQ